MKSFICVLLLAAVVAAEPPRYRQSKYRFAREEGEESGNERESFKSEREGSAPYPASGNKPHREFRLPVRQELAPPATSYGTPDINYSAPLYVAPLAEYGVPRGRSFQVKEGQGKEEDSESDSRESAEEEGGESYSDEENEEKGDRKEKGERREKKERGEKKHKGEKKKESLEEGSDDNIIISSRGTYYVLLPSSELQRVQFQTENDLAKMAYTARLQYKNEGQAPVYVYTAVPQYQPPAAYTAVVPSYQPSASYSAYSVQQQW